jgi:hypothetical protein
MTDAVMYVRCKSELRDKIKKRADAEGYVSANAYICVQLTKLMTEQDKKRDESRALS